VTFLVCSIWLGELRFGLISDQLIFGPIRLSYKNKQLCRKFQIRYGFIRVNSGLGSIFGSDMNPGRSVRISGLQFVLPGLLYPSSFAVANS